jgi:hypothetical protein
MLIEQLARERSHSNLVLAEQLRSARKVRSLHRARRRERKAERQMVAAWSRAAELHNLIESAEY